MSTKTRRMALSSFKFDRRGFGGSTPASHTRGPNPNPQADFKRAQISKPVDYSKLTRDALVPHAEAAGMRVKSKTTKKAMIEWITSGQED